MEDCADAWQREAFDILESTPLIDGHNDWPHLIRAYYQNRLDTRFATGRALVGHVDIQRLLRGKSGGAFWSAFMPWQAFDLDFSFSKLSLMLHDSPSASPSKQASLACFRDTIQQIDLIHRLAEYYRDHLQIIERPLDILEVFQRKKFACMIGIEGLHQIGESSSALRMFHRLGVRYITLTHNRHNVYADSATEKPPRYNNGLSELGKAMIKEMNRVGIMIDLSHASPDTIHDVFEIAAVPVAFTHSSIKAIVATDRNVDDEMLEKLKTNRGIIMISFVPALTHEDIHQANVTHVVDHIVYVGEKIGYDFVGLGSDYDGMLRAVNGLEDVSQFPTLVVEMLKRGIARKDVEKVVGLNIIRVLQEVEEYADAHGRAMDVLEDDVEPLWDEDLLSVARSLYPDAA